MTYHAPAGAPDCDRGHRVAGDNLYLSRENGTLTPRCRSCAGAPRNDVEQRARAARLARERRARLKIENPDKHEDVLRRTTERRDRRLGRMTEEQREARRQRILDDKRTRALIMKALNVTGAEYHSLLEEETLSEVELARNQDRPSAAWNLLKVKGDALPVWDEFSKYLEITETPCQSSTAWTEYDDPRPGREDENTGTPMPTKSVAEKMCQQCPLIDLCQNFAKKDKPDFGVWGGERWLGGKRV